MENYKWAVNETKVNRAILALKKAGQEVTEESVKNLYIQYGGAINENPDVEEDEVIEEEAPRKRRTA